VSRALRTLLSFAKAWRQARCGADKSFQAYGESVEVSDVCPYSRAQCLDQDCISAGAAVSAAKAAEDGDGSA